MKTFQQLESDLLLLLDVYEQIEADYVSLESEGKEVEKTLKMLEAESESIKAESTRIGFEFDRLNSMFLKSFSDTEVAFFQQNLSESKDIASKVYFNVDMGVSALKATAGPMLSNASSSVISDMSSVNYVALPLFILTSAAVLSRLNQTSSQQSDNNAKVGNVETGQDSLSNIELLLKRLSIDSSKVNQNSTTTQDLNFEKLITDFIQACKELKNNFLGLQEEIQSKNSSLEEPERSSSKWHSLKPEEKSVNIVDAIEKVVGAIESLEKERDELNTAVQKYQLVIQQLTQENKKMQKQNLEVNVSMESLKKEMYQKEYFKKSQEDESCKPSNQEPYGYEQEYSKGTSNKDSEIFFNDVFSYAKEGNEYNGILFEFEKAIRIWEEIKVQINNMNVKMNESGKLRFEFSTQFEQLKIQLSNTENYLRQILDLTKLLVNELNSTMNTFNAGSVINELDRKALMEKLTEMKELLATLEKKISIHELSAFKNTWSESNCNNYVAPTHS